MSWTKIMECVPNFSEGRDLQKIDQIVSPFRARAGVKLLDYSNCLLYTSPSPRDAHESRMPSSA